MDDSVGDKCDSSIDPSKDICLSKIARYLNCCARLHHVIHLIKNEHISDLELANYLTNTLKVMEVVATDPKFLEEEDDDDTHQDVIPAEVKDWLASTFTSTVKVTRKLERPRFRAVAKAVLAMIMVEKIFKKSNDNASLMIPLTVTKMMDRGINEWDFDVFHLNKISGGHGLKNLTMYLFLHHNILRKYKISVDYLEAFLTVIEDGYDINENAFYNVLHVADVLRTIHYFIHEYKLNVWLTDLQTFTLLFSALVHDYDHPGVSNSFLVKTNDPLALIYNDIQIVENHSLSSVFKILQDPNFNFLRAMYKNDFTEFRKMTIECVLNMDTSQHFHQMKQMRTDIQVSDELDKVKVMSFLLHVADMSYAAKQTDFHIKWIDMLNEQFYKQGQLERQLNIPYSPLCNRENKVRVDAINGFFLYVVDPLFRLLEELIEEIHNQNMFVKPSTTSNLSSERVKNKSSGGFIGLLYPWENIIVMNKNVWQRRFLNHTTSS